MPTGSQIRVSSRMVRFRNRLLVEIQQQQELTESIRPTAGQTMLNDPSSRGIIALLNRRSRVRNNTRSEGSSMASKVVSYPILSMATIRKPKEKRAISRGWSQQQINNQRSHAGK